MTAVYHNIPMGSMDNRGTMYSTGTSYVGNYVSPTPSIYPSSYEASPPLPSAYSSIVQPSTAPSQGWSGQDLTLFSHTERAIAKERRREQNRASQRAYRKRKEDTVKGLYDSVKDLRKDSTSLKAENIYLKDKTVTLQAELETLREENRELRSRVSSCMQCIEAGLSCSKANNTCTRCDESGLTCSSASPGVTGRHLTSELSEYETGADDTVQEAQTTRDSWYDSQNDIPVLLESTTASGMPVYDVGSYGGHSTPERQHSPYADKNQPPDIISDNYQPFLRPNPRQLYRAQSLRSVPIAIEQIRQRSASLYDAH